ncbi:hypothetical protein ACJMK2_022527, partial [Sinanodonta woodiana]
EIDVDTPVPAQKPQQLMRLSPDETFDVIQASNVPSANVLPFTLRPIKKNEKPEHEEEYSQSSKESD